MSAPAEARFARPSGYSLSRCLGGLAMGAGDPTFQASAHSVRLAIQTPEGPASLELCEEQDALRARAWGEAAPWLLSRAEAALGLLDPAERFSPVPGPVARLWQRFAPLRLPRLPRVFARVAQVVLLQRVIRQEGCRAWRRLVGQLGDAAPGPPALRVPPPAATLAAVPHHDLVSWGVPPAQARTLLAAARRARRLETAAERGVDALALELGGLPGVGPWTTQYVLGSALGHPDAVLVGDYHLPHTAAWVLAGEERGDDARMLELLEPYRGDRFRVIRLLWLSGVAPPRRGPRRPFGPRVP